MLTPHHWLLGEGELSARLWTPRISIEVTRDGGVISLSVWDPEPEPLLNWSVCGTLRVSGLNSVWWSFLSSPVGWVGRDCWPVSTSQSGAFRTHRRPDKWPR